ncbi:MAG: hypothetical protein NTZ64_10005 [Polaromonas sp.]|nr:hypothetical protein [Polaromonas sp.]
MHNFSLNEFETIDIRSLISIFACSENRPKLSAVWTATNEVKPSDLFCYLFAKFGPPNGLQNYLRGNTSNNLIHWEWTLKHPSGFMSIQGGNLRTEFQLFDLLDISKDDIPIFYKLILQDFKNYGKEMSKIRHNIFEDWDLITNPYKSIKDSIKKMKSELEKLQLDPDKDDAPDFLIGSDLEASSNKFRDLSEKYSHATGICMGVRALTPVMAESFINLLIFILAKKEIKQDEKRYTAIIRTNIKEKIESLHVTCHGFLNPLDWSNEICGKYSSVVNERNDLLHGNIVLSKLKFSEIFFIGTIPVFKKYDSMWRRSFGSRIESSGIKKYQAELSAVENFIEYVKSSLEEKTKIQIKILSESHDIGWNKKENRIGILLPEHVVDARPDYPVEVLRR